MFEVSKILVALPLQIGEVLSAVSVMPRTTVMRKVFGSPAQVLVELWGVTVPSRANVWRASKEGSLAVKSAMAVLVQSDVQSASPTLSRGAAEVKICHRKWV